MLGVELLTVENSLDKGRVRLKMGKLALFAVTFGYSCKLRALTPHKSCNNKGPGNARVKFGSSLGMFGVVSAQQRRPT